MTGVVYSSITAQSAGGGEYISFTFGVIILLVIIAIMMLVMHEFNKITEFIYNKCNKK